MVEYLDIIYSHPQHPSHELKRNFFPNQFTCNGCNTLGYGFRYYCSSSCNFNLHEFCATCPSKLPFPFFMHPNHRLKLHTPRNSICHFWLRKLKRNPKEETGLVCDLCQEDIDKESHIFFTCNSKACSGFNVHPLCSQLPQKVNHESHDRVNRGDPHELGLQRSEENVRCRVCKEICRGWRYSCDREQCKVDIHIKCIRSETGGRRFNIAKILMRLGVAVVSAFATNVGIPVAGQAITSVFKGT